MSCFTGVLLFQRVPAMVDAHADQGQGNAADPQYDGQTQNSYPSDDG